MKNTHPPFTLMPTRSSRSPLHRLAGGWGLFAALLLVPALPLFAEGDREFQQDPKLTLPLTDNFDSVSASEKFPDGWNGIYLDEDHNFRVTDNVPVADEPFSEPNALALFSRGAAANGSAPLLYVIVPKSNSLWLKFDFYFDPKDNYFRAGLGDSGYLHFGIAAADKRFFVISRGKTGETSTAIPPEYMRPREWNSILIGRDENMGQIKINDQDIEIEMDEVVSMDYVKFSIGSPEGGSSNLLIDNVEIDLVPLED
jgi:hypothetical protein